MNQPTPFDQLCAILTHRFGIDRARLIDALFLIRAPYSLQAVVACSRHLRALIETYPQIQAEPAFPDQAERLAVLDLISTLEDVPDFFRFAHVDNDAPAGRGEGHPIYRYSGDSGLAELLVAKPPEIARNSSIDNVLGGVDGSLRTTAATAFTHERDFARLRVWFSFQTFHHQSRRADRAHYVRYLTGDGTLRLKAGAGSRIYGASLAIRRLADPSLADYAREIAALLENPSARESVALASQLTRAASKDATHSVMGKRNVGAMLEDSIVRLREIARAQEGEKLPILAALARFLRYVWTADDVRQRDMEGHGGGRRGVASIRIYPDALAITAPVPLGADHAGVEVRFYRRFPEEPGLAPPPGIIRPDYDDDPTVDEPVEPVISVFIADGKPSVAWHASKSVAHRIERINAMLHWPVWRLSEAGIASVIREVVLCPTLECPNGSSEHVRETRARLAVGLSLLTGRQIETLTAPYITYGVPPLDEVGIDLRDHVLHLPVPRPDLRHFVWKADPFPAYCTHWSGTVRLPLPQAWWPLVDTLQRSRFRSSQSVAKHARALLTGLPRNLSVTGQGVAGALGIALQQSSRDDLAFVKIVTDMDIGNARNLIHYASYPRADVEAQWRGIVERWCGPVPNVALSTTHADERVGSPYGIDVSKVGKCLRDLKERFQQSVERQEWAAVFNQMTFYTALWFGLATAGRRVCQPVPGIVLADGWALVRDKSRPDESTDRYVPLTDALRSQLAALQAFAEILALTQPGLARSEPGSRHGMELQALVRGRRRDQTASDHLKVRPFQPLFLDKTTLLRDLPGNWGRKLVRSDSPELSGWFKDAGLGHWVRGRHPWTTIAPFPTARFRRQWLDLQHRLERDVGLEVLAVPGLSRPIRAVVPPLPSREPAPKEPCALPPMSSERIEVLIAKTCDPKRCAAVLEAASPTPDAVRALAEEAISAHLKESKGRLLQVAQGVCRYLRGKTGINVFARQPRGRFQHNWLVNRHEFGCLAYTEHSLLSAIQGDLANLPARNADSPQVATGRLLAALAWRGGVLSTHHLDACLMALAGGRDEPQDSAGAGNVRGNPTECAVADGDATQAVTDPAFESGSDQAINRTETVPALDARGRRIEWQREQPVYAVGELRALSLPNVRSRRSAATMNRTLLMEPYLAAMVTVERGFVRPFLARIAQRDARPRADAWDRAFRAYLGFLGQPRDLSLPTFVGALRQRMMLDASPLLAAYASGETLTFDLPVSEFCRLAGYEAPDALDRASTWSDAMESDAADEAAPSDIDPGYADFGATLGSFESNSLTAWFHHIRDATNENSSGEQTLLARFAAYLLTQYYEHGRRHGLGTKQRLTIAQQLRVVWDGLMAAAAESPGWTEITEAGLQAMMEWTQNDYSSRVHHGAWHAFRAFLQDPQRDHAGYQVSGIATDDGDAVNARIFSTDELDDVARLLPSIRSGIGTEEYREVASRHFALTRATGARREEATGLRWADVEEDLLRIRAYAGHTLKTASAERCIPTTFLEPAVWQWLLGAMEEGKQQVIDALPARPAVGDNFYDAASKVMKRVAGDVNHSHHAVRHTLASGLALKLLDGAVDFSHLADELPWLASLLPDDRRVDALMGSAGQCGQGLKAVAALVGHLHETTTLRHYIHTMGIALYAYTSALPRIPLHIAFDQRASSHATLARHARRALTEVGRCEKTESLRDAFQDRRVRDHLEVAVERGRHEVDETASAPWLVRPARRRAVAASAMITEDVELPDVHDALKRLEALQEFLMRVTGTPPAGIDFVRSNLVALAALRTGKRGMTAPRHVLSVRTPDGIRLPALVEGGESLNRAVRILAWLLRLRRDHADEYAWFLEQWCYASAADDGSMGLAGEAERARAIAINDVMVESDVMLAIEASKISDKRQRSGQRTRERMRVRLLDQRPGHKRRFLTRGLSELRWVLTWLVVDSGVPTAAR